MDTITDDRVHSPAQTRLSVRKEKSQSLYDWIQAQLKTLSVHAEIIYSLLGTCKLNDVESEAWLRDVLWKISDWSSNRVHELLPWNLETVK
ncbi:transposase (remnant) [Salmonella enterica subsp. enterica]|uniref:Transposase (Remnant) n=1 Tax=Salmonella enterica I TaxID=59201 RepID=A0A447MUL4_SALET|nr:hypothetical protein SEECH997_014510 [Salmonella enterica subsp. enterica serovar Chester str. ATCC 11997]OSJ55373.1 transposase [Salmonella enterica subsp. enterica serovar Newport str. SHSN001]OXX98120.1 transposase [Salmonella enterica subsp. enterica serovar Newport str. CVM80_2288]CUR90204.1 transposase (remnant) [Salmonella enterica subsp. enterica serovar Weltevreden]VDZ94765.1 transposase (remnant) [Salmonella enterica subsp. enterica]